MLHSYINLHNYEKLEWIRTCNFCCLIWRKKLFKNVLTLIQKQDYLLQAIVRLFKKENICLQKSL